MINFWEHPDDFLSLSSIFPDKKDANELEKALLYPIQTFHYSVSGLVKRAQFEYWDERQTEKKLEQTWSETRDE